MNLKLVNPYKNRNISIKDFYKKELELNKTQDYIYMYYEDETGKQFMKKVFNEDAAEIINNI